MIQRTNRLLIGKDISRDAQVIAGATLATITLSTGLADGEVVVLDKYKKVLTEGATIADTDIIFICQGTSETFTYTDEAGNAITSARKIKISDPIEGAKVKKYVGKSYTAKAERTAAVTLTGMTLAAGTEYFIRIIYKDMVEHPGQFTQTYRHVATATSAATVAALCDALVAKVNAHSGRRITATDDTTGLTLTGLPIPECTTGLTDIDEFDMVNFDVRFLYVDSSGNWQIINSTSTTVTYTGPTFGSGTWEQIRDMEKGQLGYEGITNRIYWPVKLPAVDTVKSATYDVIIIEHDKSYLSPDNQYVKQAPLTTVLAFVVPSSGTQESSVLAQLNPWLASCPGAFANVSV